MCNGYIMTQRRPAPATPSPALQRISLALEPASAANLKTLMQHDHVGTTDAIRKAVAFRLWFYSQTDAGHSVFIHHQDGTTERVVVLHG